jgi:hypothetical protein
VQIFAKYALKSCIEMVTSVKFVCCTVLCIQYANRVVERHLEMRLVDSTGKNLGAGGK